MFHPDNIKNYTLDGVPVSIALHQYWSLIGGPQGLARSLKTNLKVSCRIISDNLENILMKISKAKLRIYSSYLFYL